jgi:hypothetical protein
MYDTVSQFASSATTSGSPRACPTNGFRRAASKENAAAAQPTTAIATSVRGLGGDSASRGSTSSRAVAGTAVAPSYVRVAPRVLLCSAMF